MLPFIAFILWLSTKEVSGADPPMGRHGCQVRCGNVTVPFPFGIGSGCYFNEWYSVTCNDSTPILAKFNLEVIDIDLGFREVKVNSPMVINCTAGNTTWTSINLGGSPYSYSTLENVFAPVNCFGTSLSIGQENIVAQCSSFCEYGSRVTSFTGDEVCQTDLPFSLSVYSVNITRANGTCSYSLMLDSDYLETFDLSDPQKSVLPIARNGSYIPVTLSWIYQYIPNSLQDASPFCSKLSDAEAYICSCPQGEGGNPYLSDGCQESEICARCDGDCFASTANFTDAICIASNKRRVHNLAVISGVSVAIGLFILTGVCYWLYRLLRKMKESKQKAKYFKRNGGLLLQQQMSSNDGVVDKTKLFTAKELEAATDNFNENRILGQGGQGTVYKGMLTDGRIVAVKRSKPVNESQLEPFVNEVVILSRINHRNVVKLLGCCLETEVPLLVYEFIPNGALSKHIHNPSEDFYISWKMRVQIAAESAGAIAYLHSSSSTPIYHRDIKSSNILLDDKYRAKVSDFGTSRTIAIDQTHLTTQVQGTFGYLDPEYFQTNQFSEKSDVYSFGVVLVELLTSKKPISPDKSKEWRSLTTEFLYMIENSRLLEILDPLVLKDSKEEDILAMASLAKDCLNLNGKLRPTMKEVAMVLEGLRSHNGTSTIQQALPDLNKLAPDVTELDVEPPYCSSTFASTRDGSSIIIDM